MLAVTSKFISPGSIHYFYTNLAYFWTAQTFQLDPLSYISRDFNEYI